MNALKVPFLVASFIILSLLVSSVPSARESTKDSIKPRKLKQETNSPLNGLSLNSFFLKVASKSSKVVRVGNGLSLKSFAFMETLKSQHALKGWTSNGLTKNGFQRNGLHQNGYQRNGAPEATCHSAAQSIYKNLAMHPLAIIQE